MTGFLGDCFSGSAFGGAFERAYSGLAIEGRFKGVALTVGAVLLGVSLSVKHFDRIVESRFCGKRFEGSVSHVGFMHCEV